MTMNDRAMERDRRGNAPNIGRGGKSVPFGTFPPSHAVNASGGHPGPIREAIEIDLKARTDCGVATSPLVRELQVGLDDDLGMPEIVVVNGVRFVPEPAFSAEDQASLDAVGEHLFGAGGPLERFDKPSDEPLYLIRKGGLFYRPDAAGYTSSKAEAGRYTLRQALLHTYPNGPTGPRDELSYELAPMTIAAYTPLRANDIDQTIAMIADAGSLEASRGGSVFDGKAIAQMLDRLRIQARHDREEAGKLAAQVRTWRCKEVEASELLADARVLLNDVKNERENYRIKDEASRSTVAALTDRIVALTEERDAAAENARRERDEHATTVAERDRALGSALVYLSEREEFFALITDAQPSVRLVNDWATWSDGSINAFINAHKRKHDMPIATDLAYRMAFAMLAEIRRVARDRLGDDGFTIPPTYTEDTLKNCEDLAATTLMNIGTDYIIARDGGGPRKRGVLVEAILRCAGMRGAGE